ncbi:ChuX/HutX family heme-like substrate-binding protein, partial [Escherichia coli]|uniref:ChuX/HutX family heme-like substrate-binding protein n=1 Tax=Escherichia coli TaxID=562 RepID=UPI0025A53D4B
RKGPYREVTVSANGQMGLVVSPDIDLRLFLGGWNAVFAIAEETARGTQRSIQVFDQQGVAVHKVFTRPGTHLAAWQALRIGWADPAAPAPQWRHEA